MGVGAVQAADLPPEYVAHLAERRRGAKGDGGVLVGVYEPEQGHGRAEALAQAIARFDRHPAVFHQGAEYLALFGPELHPQHVGGELQRGRDDARLFLHPA